MSDSPTRKVELVREGRAVLLTINCVDDYAAMLLYDQCATELAEGYLEIEIETAVDIQTRDPEIPTTQTDAG